MSYNGNVIAFISECPGMWQLNVVDIEQRIITKVSDKSGGVSAPSVSFDGNLIAFADANGRIQVANLEERTITNISREGDHHGYDHSPIISGDGTYVAYMSNNIYVDPSQPDSDYYSHEHLEVYIQGLGVEYLSRVVSYDVDLSCSSMHNEIREMAFSPDSKELEFVVDTINHRAGEQAREHLNPQPKTYSRNLRTGEIQKRDDPLFVLHRDKEFYSSKCTALNGIEVDLVRDLTPDDYWNHSNDGSWLVVRNAGILEHQ